MRLNKVSSSSLPWIPSHCAAIESDGVLEATQFNFEQCNDTRSIRHVLTSLCQTLPLFPTC